MRHLYSEAICAFTRRAEFTLRSILAEECDVRVGKTRFYRDGYSWPIQVVVFDQARVLGYFQPEDFCIGLHYRFMTEAKQAVVKNVLRHELAHYLRWIDNGQREDTTPHSTGFRALCATFGWGPEVFQASGDIETENATIEGDLQADELISKVKKLFALAESANAHEAELATRKANEIIIKYNLSFLSKEGVAAGANPFSRLVNKKVLRYKRRSQKHTAILRILGTFGVFAVFSAKSIRVTGPEASVAVVEYVAQFLDRKLEDLYISAKQSNPNMRGAVMKNSFFRGIGQGYLHKIQQDQAGVTKGPAQEGGSALSLVDQVEQYQDTLAEYVQRWVYRRLSAAKSSAKVHSAAHSLGEQVGKNLQIAQPIVRKADDPVLFLQ